MATKFEEIGVSIQIQAYTKEYAIKSFDRSCRICCTHGMHINCDRCAIAEAHRLTIAAIETKNNK